MGLTNKLNINQRLTAFVAFFIILVFIALGILNFSFLTSQITHSTNQYLKSEVNNLNNLLTTQQKLKQERINTSMNLAQSLFKEKITIKILDSVYQPLSVTNQLTGDPQNIKIKTWMVDSNQLLNNFEFVDFLKDKGIESATIFQKIPQGYLRISTTITTLTGKRAVGTYIPNTSQVVQTIETGNGYRGEAFVVNDHYLTAYEPIYIDNEIAGMLYVGVKKMDYDKIKPVFSQKKYFDKAYPVLVSQTGKMLIHPTRENEDVSNNKFFIQLQKAYMNNENQFSYILNQQPQKVYFNYIEELDAFVCVTLPESVFYQNIKKLSRITLIMIIIAIIILVISINLLFRPLNKWINRLVNIIHNMSKGETVKIISHKRKDEIGKIINSLNVLIKGLNRTAEFAQQIETGNLNKSFTPLSEKDQLGNALLDMRDSLIKANKEHEQRQKEDRQRNWISHGVAHFSEILRKNQNNIEMLSRNIIVELVKYLKANQGGIYLIQDSDKDDVHIRQAACFAYDRLRKEKKRFEMDEGLIGRCIYEKKAIYLTDVPEGYISITSGLGEKPPDALLISPLNLNNQILGAIEIASFTPFNKTQLEFIEKVCESIAATINSVKVNYQTIKLLEESQQQSEELSAQEEEMRQNIEELQATQEESERREKMLESKMAELKQTKKKLDEKDRIQRAEIEKLQKDNEKKVEQILIKEEQSRKILENNLDAVIIIDDKGTIEFFNHSAEKLWGYNKSEVLGEDVKLLMPDKHAAKHQQYIDNYLKTGIKKVLGKGREIEIKRKDSTLVPGFLSLIDSKVSERQKFTAFIRDLTNEKKNEQEQTKLMENIMAKEFKFQTYIEKLQDILENHQINFPEIDQEQSLIQWNKDYKLGIESIDKQHIRLIQIINNFYTKFEQGLAGEELKKYLEQLFDYTQYHFSFEEELFSKINYHKKNEHTKEHKDIIHKLQAFNEKYRKGNVTVSYDLMNFLKAWLSHHIKMIDKDYVEAFKKNGIT